MNTDKHRFTDLQNVAAKVARSGHPTLRADEVAEVLARLGRYLRHLRFWQAVGVMLALRRNAGKLNNRRF